MSRKKRVIRNIHALNNYSFWTLCKRMFMCKAKSKPRIIKSNYRDNKYKKRTVITPVKKKMNSTIYKIL